MGDQVLSAVGLARSLVAAASTLSLGGGRKLKLVLSIGIHTGPAQVRRASSPAITRGVGAHSRQPE